MNSNNFGIVKAVGTFKISHFDPLKRNHIVKWINSIFLSIDDDAILADNSDIHVVSTRRSYCSAENYADALSKYRNVFNTLHSKLIVENGGRPLLFFMEIVVHGFDGSSRVLHYHESLPQGTEISYSKPETFVLPNAVLAAVNDHICPSCRNDRCSKSEKSCWKCGNSL
jgi:hypothetical protein